MCILVLQLLLVFMPSSKASLCPSVHRFLLIDVPIYDEKVLLSTRVESLGMGLAAHPSQLRL